MQKQGQNSVVRLTQAQRDRQIKGNSPTIRYQNKNKQEINKESLNVVLIGMDTVGIKKVIQVLGFKFKKQTFENQIASKIQQKIGNINQNQITFLSTVAHNLCLINLSAFQQFLDKWIIGISMGDSSILFVSASQALQTQSFSKYLSHINKQLTLLFTFGIKNIDVCIGDINQHNIQISQQIFDKIKLQIIQVLSKIGFKTNAVNFIPISAQKGDNIFQRSPLTPWFSGKTLYQSLNQINLPKRQTTKPLRIPIINYSRTKQQIIITGIIKYGIMSQQTQIVIAPKKIKSKIIEIRKCNTVTKKAQAGDHVKIRLKRVQQNLQEGYVLGDLHNDYPSLAKKFQAHIVIMQWAQKELNLHQKIKLHCHTTSFQCQVQSILSRINKLTGMEQQLNPQKLSPNQVGIVCLKPLDQICIQKFQQYASLGRFAISINSVFFGAGFIKQIEKI